MVEETPVKNFTTMVDVINYYTECGYTYTFTFDKKSDSIRPEDWCINGFYRFEGKTNPSDNSIVYLLIKKDGSEKGMLINSYGVYASEQIDQFIQKVMTC